MLFLFAIHLESLSLFIIKIINRQNHKKVLLDAGLHSFFSDAVQNFSSCTAEKKFLNVHSRWFFTKNKIIRNDFA